MSDQLLLRKQLDLKISLLKLLAMSLEKELETALEAHINTLNEAFSIDR